MHNFVVMNRLLFIIIFIAVAASRLTAEVEPDDSIAAQRARQIEEEYVNAMGRADSAIAAGEWLLAETILRDAMHSQPANPANLLMLSNIGMLQFYQGKDSLALETLTDACNIAPRAVAVHANRATVLEALGRGGEAVAECNIILALDSANTRARAMRLSHEIRRGNMPAATADLDTLQRLRPDDILTHISEATLYTAQGRYAEAVSPLTKVIDADPRAEYYAARAYCRLMTDNLNDASADINQGLALDPSDGELYLYRAILNKMRYRLDDARADAQRAEKLGVDPERTRFLVK